MLLLLVLTIRLLPRRLPDLHKKKHKKRKIDGVKYSDLSKKVNLKLSFFILIIFNLSITAPRHYHLFFRLSLTLPMKIYKKHQKCKEEPD